MRSTRAGGWVAGAIVLTLAIFASTWFFGAQPRLDAAAQTREQEASTRAQNATLRAKIAELKKDFDNLDEYRSELATLRTQVPTGADLSGYTRVLQGLADTAGVTLTSLAPGVPQVVTPPGADQAQPAPAATDTTVDGAGSGDATPAPVDPAAEAAASLAKQIDGMVAMPMTITVVGTYAGVSTFLQSVQTGADRLYLAVSLDGARQLKADASGGRPATEDGDLELAIDGWLYVLPQSSEYRDFLAAQGEGTVTPDTPGPPELPGSDRNPFTPLPGT